MPIEKLILFGAGGHARVVIDALECLDHQYEIVLCSDNPAQTGQPVFGHTVSLLDPAAASGTHFHVCIGDARTRERQHLRLAALGARPLTIRHPSAIVARSATIAQGCFLAAGAIVSADAQLGQSTIINHAAVADHQAVVGSFCHIAPGATLAGNTSVGDLSLIGAGARVLPGIRVGNACVLGAGAVLTADMPDESRYSGIPARRIS
jgi:sugar O-acyltransferase (sialic acid O-acetyltransferase NeuD family)